MNSLLKLLLPLAAVTLIAPSAALAQKNAGASSGPTMIAGGTSNVTYVISKSGSYLLGGDRVMTEPTLPNISIAAPDVTLDLAGFTLSHPIGVSGPGAGIQIATPENVEIRNGSITNSAHAGVRSGQGKGLRLFDLRIAGARNHAIWSETENTVVQRCQVTDANGHGVFITAAYGVVENTNVTGCVSTGISSAIWSRIDRCIVAEANIGVRLGVFGTLTDSNIGYCKITGVTVQDGRATIRNNMIAYNTKYGIHIPLGSSYTQISGNTITSTQAQSGVQAGIYTQSNTTSLSDNRMNLNGTNVSGSYVDAGGNVLQ